MTLVLLPQSSLSCISLPAIHWRKKFLCPPRIPSEKREVKTPELTELLSETLGWGESTKGFHLSEAALQEYNFLFI